jgi:poly(3-hydroxybutyrate) depolymerase
MKQRRVTWHLFLAVVALLAADAASAEPGKISKEKIAWRGKERISFLYVPTGVAPGQALPLVVCLHGSGRDGEPILSKWKDLAEKEKILLAGPNSTDSVHWGSPQDGPLFLRDVVEHISAKYPVDGRRVYLFGHSAGALFALQMGSLESEYFAAAVIHAGALQPAYFSLFDYASRKIPFLMVIGTRDALFPLESVQATRDALKARGFPVEYVEMSGHTHDYYGSAKEINPKAWEFLKKNPLPADPKYTAYQDPD